MRLTLRGWAVVAIVAGSYAMAWLYGPQTLNAIVTPLLIVLIAGIVTTARVDRPEIRREPVAEGFIGEKRTVEIPIEVGGSLSATVRDTVSDGLSVTGVDTAGTASVDDTDDGGSAPRITTILEGDDRVTYEIRLEKRGEQRLGPLTVVVSDLFGLVERRFGHEETTTVLVYPHVRELHGGPGRDLRTVVAGANRERTEFDHLREYQRGDSLRDVHWKSAAKRPDDELVVTEYADDEEIGAVSVAAECIPSREDELATAVASVATRLLESGLDVGLRLPDGSRPPGSGREHHRDLLARLAVLDAGELEERHRRDVDVLIQADANGARLIVDDRTIPFDELVDGEMEYRQNGQSPTTQTDSGATQTGTDTEVVG